MSDYEKHLANALLENSILSPAKSYYGGFDSYTNDHYKHIKWPASTREWEMSYKPVGKPKCAGWSSVSDVQELNEMEFAGTFTNANKVYLVRATVSCACNKIKDAYIWYQGTLSELILSVNAPKNHKNLLGD